MPTTTPSMIMQGATTWLVKRALGPFRRRRAELERSQWLDADALERYQLDHLRDLLRHCYETIPFYRRRFDACGVKPADVTQLADLARLPTLTKPDVLAAGDDIVSTAFSRSRLRTAHTGGTTGTPLDIRRDMQAIGIEHAFVRRQWDWAGVGLRDRTALLTGRLIVSPNQTSGPMYRYDPVMGELVLSTYHLTPSRALEYADAMRRFRVCALVAYPSSALVLARSLLENDRSLPLRAVLTSSETLTDDGRQTLTAAFECPVFDFYGSAERVCYIHTCEKGSYHVVPEYGVTELLPVDGDPKLRQVIATGFWNRAMPFVRYDTGDVVRPADDACPCGRVFPRVERIEGRVSDVIVTPDGRRLGAALLTHLLYGASNIRESQLVQDAPDHVELRYVRAAAFAEADRLALQRLVEMHLPQSLRVELLPVDALERTQSGKLRPIISRLNGARANA